MNDMQAEDTQATLRVINEMQAKGVIGKYVIGGAIAATYYIEATATYDIDIFIPFDNAPLGSLALLSPIYDYLLPLGYKPVGEHIMIEGWQVQFLPADDALYKESLNHAIEVDAGQIKTWVMTAEYLMAIALRTGRGKDFIRLEHFVHLGAYDESNLIQILNRHNLFQKWEQFNEKYIGSGK
jgi:hypothetical protein